MKSLLSVNDLSDHALEEIVSRSESFETNTARSGVAKKRGVIATVFSSSSTRTQIVVAAAAAAANHTLVTISPDPDEPFNDVVSSVSAVADVTVVRTNSLTPEELRDCAQGPVINALCLGYEHSLSAIWQLVALRKLFGSLKGLKVGIYGQTAHCRPYLTIQLLLARFGAVILHDPVLPLLANPKSITTQVLEAGGQYQLVDLRNSAPDIDVLLIADGLPMSSSISGEEEEAFRSYQEHYQVVDLAFLSRWTPDISVNYMMPRLLPDGSLTVSPALDYDPRVYNDVLLRQGVYATAALFDHLIS